MTSYHDLRQRALEFVAQWVDRVPVLVLAPVREAIERHKIDEEYEQVIKTIAYLESILASDQKVRMLIKQDMDDVVKKYGDERRTEITDQEASELSAEDLVPKEEVVVTLTHRGYAKRQPLRVFRAQKRGGVGLKGARPTAGSARWALRKLQ